MSTSTDTGHGTLPDGWKWVKLGDVCVAIRGVTFKSGVSLNEPRDGYVPCVTTSAVQLQPDWSTARHVPANSVRGDAQMLRVGDILVSTANSKALVGKSCLVEHVPFECTFGAFVTVVRPHSTVEQRWLTDCLRSDSAKRFFYEKSSNTTNISNLRVSDLLMLDIPIPPLDEQKRIAGMLTEQMAAVDKAKRAAQERLEAAQALPAAYLRGAFPASQDELPATWRWVELMDIVVENGLVRGPFGGSLKKEIFVASGYMVYEQSHAIGGDFSSGRYFVTEAKYREMARFQVKPYDLLMSCSGTIGKVAMVPEESPAGIINQALLKIRVNHEIAKPQYLKYYLESSPFSSRVAGLSAGTAMANVASVKYLRAVSIPVPPLEEQTRITARLDDQNAAALLAEEHIRQEIGVIETLPSALLRKAFSGEL